MPRRLAVVVSQSSTSSAARRQLEESLITNLLLESGLDVNVVPNIPDLSSDQTGLLCLEGIQGPMVLVSWLTDEEAQSALSSRGIQARLGRTSFSSQQPSSRQNSGAAHGGRVLYAIDMKAFDRPDPICAEIRRIRDDLATPTISILGAAPPSIPIAPPPEPAKPVPTAAAAAAPAVHQQQDGDDDPALDRLVQMLDEMDL